MPALLLTQSDFLAQGCGGISIHREPRQPPSQRHRHEFWEIVVVLSGCATHVVGKARYPIGRGCAFVIREGRVHSFENVEQLNLVNLLVHPDVIKQMGVEGKNLPGFTALFYSRNVAEKRWEVWLKESELELVTEWLNRLEEEIHRNAPGGELIARAYLTLIAGVLSRRVALEKERRSPAGRSLTRVLSWIEQNLDRPLRLADLAQEAGMSERSFQRHFQQTMQCAPSVYVSHARLRKAEGMLSHRQPPYRVKEIATACGFEDVSYFCSWFLKQKGSTPSAFRRERSGLFG